MTILLSEKHYGILDVFKIFYNEIKNQFVTFLKIINIDITLEYMQSLFKHFCASHGIIH